MEEPEDEQLRSGSANSACNPFPPFSVVSLHPFSPVPCPSPRRLSSHFTPSRSVPSARRLAWVSLQGRLVNAEEASSAKSINGGLSQEETLAWELFTPMQRFLLVAVIGVAVSESKKNRLVSRLKKSVELRDQVLSSMQQKLDDLCNQLNHIKSPAGSQASKSHNKGFESLSSDAFGCDKIKFVECGCWHCDEHQDLYTYLLGNSAAKFSRANEVLQYKATLINEVEQEERRMSDLSDWASSVTSAADIQMNSFPIDHDIFNLKRECEEKDATIKELTTMLQSANVAGSKRIAELEDIIRRKNSVISRLKKEIMVLEQKIVQLTRLRRPSFSSISDSSQLPLMVENIVYGMDNTTSPSSSDSDSSPVNRSHSATIDIQEISIQNGDPASAMNLEPAQGVGSRPSHHHVQSRSARLLKELSTNQKSGRFSSSSHPRQLYNVDSKKIRRQTQASSTDSTPKRRWV